MKELKKKQYFFKHQGMDYGTLIVLGGCRYGAADPGEVISTVSRVADGDFEGWFRQWTATAERVLGIAEGCAAAGNRLSARNAYLRAAGYFAAANSMVDGSDDPSRVVPTWKRHLACWEEFCSRLDPPAEKVAIPYGATPMPGYLFRPAGGGPRPTVIFNNGSDGPTCAMWASGIAAALARGYAALSFDGPGQNAMLWLHNIPFRYDWEKVITPVVDFLQARPEVDPGRIALSGISQGGYWILRALAFEERIAAGIADPGVMDVSTAMMEKLGSGLVRILEQGEAEKFNRRIRMGLRLMGRAGRREVEFRMKPYCTEDFFKWASLSREFNLREVIGKIKCPVFIADPEDEQFWPGQSRQVYEALQCPKTIVRFTAAEGANWHCQPLARGLYDQRMFDWLDTVLIRAVDASDDE